MPRYRATISYDGTNYAGWQIQQNGHGVQQSINDVLHSLTTKAVSTYGSGRTDQGVHARGQVIHFDLANAWKDADLRRAMNATLEQDVRVMNVRRTRADFDARRDAISKEYRYFIWNDEVMPPDRRYFRTHLRHRLDVDAMQVAALHLVGRLDFSAFTANSRRELETHVRNLMRLDVRRRGHEVEIRAVGEGFLYKMVRSIVGYLVRVGEGAVTPDSIREVQQALVRRPDVPTAPPQGLFLWKVSY
ncbi:MAG: tRNA pseudouridine38-40 synthase [Candidatus Promineifilaceae bacterium]|jgi:tRNA pseudouridine38-40 synthase